MRILYGLCIMTLMLLVGCVFTACHYSATSVPIRQKTIPNDPQPSKTAVLDTTFNRDQWRQDSLGCDGYRGFCVDMNYKLPVDKGMSKAEVVKRLGPPNDEEKEMLVYTLRGLCKVGEEEKEEIILIFDKDRLSSSVLSL